jgi:hypothetical protein
VGRRIRSSSSIQGGSLIEADRVLPSYGLVVVAVEDHAHLVPEEARSFFAQLSVPEQNQSGVCANGGAHERNHGEQNTPRRRGPEQPRRTPFVAAGTCPGRDRNREPRSRQREQVRVLALEEHEDARLPEIGERRTRACPGMR